MGDENTLLDAASARHLLRRSGFGAPPDVVQDMLNRGLTRGAAADELINFTGKAFKPSGRYIEDSHNKWVKFMIKTKFPLQQKLVLFWHDHFATSNNKVENTKLMANQIRTLHVMCKGNMKDFVKAINKDAAMIEFLDTVRNHKDIPNENYGRELQELFTLGVYDFAGKPNYTQNDVKTVARAFTGWDYEYNSGKSLFHDYDHDTNAEFLATRGPKVIYQTTGRFGDGMGDPDANGVGVNYSAGGEGPQEIDAVIDIIFAHRDTDKKNTVARRTTRRLIEYFAHPIADPISAADIAVVDAIVSSSSFDTTWDIGALVREIFVHDTFYSTAPPPSPTTQKSVKWPIDFVVSTVRLMHMKLQSKYQYVAANRGQNIRDQLTNMGQTLLEPPSVFGWDWETAWLSSATLLARYEFAREVTGARGGGSGAFRPEKFIDLSLTQPDDILLAVTDALGVTDQLTAAERNYLVDYLTDGVPSATLDLTDYDTRNRKLNGVFALVLQSAAYQLH